MNKTLVWGKLLQEMATYWGHGSMLVILLGFYKEQTNLMH